MGAIRFKSIDLISTVGEIVGYKSGLALTREELVGHLDEAPELQETLTYPDDNNVRVRSEEFEMIIIEILYRIGNIPSRIYAPATIMLYHKYKNDLSKCDMVMEIVLLWHKFLAEIVNNRSLLPKGSIDPKPFLISVFDKYDRVGFDLAFELIEEVNAEWHRNPFSSQRFKDWSDRKALGELFQSESLETNYGSFIDQRYIDYLSKNFNSIDGVNWRKFEGLTAEYFEKSGYYVEIGPGRDDGNIDLRIWPKVQDITSPPTILVQCKREKKKISKVIVKALWADIYEEKAQSGLIVTTTALSPGAEEVCKARSYPIQQANRSTLKKWIEEMRTPYRGIFLGE